MENLLLQHLPPHNLEEEASILNGILISDQKTFIAFDVLTPEDFYKTSHSLIFKAALSVNDRKETVDLLSIKNELGSNLETAGGAAALVDIIDRAPFPLDPEGICKRIRDNTTRRKMIEQAGSATRDAFDMSIPLHDIVDSWQREALSIYGDNTKKYALMSDMVVPAIDKLASIKESGSTGLMTGFSDLDKMTAGLHETDLIVLAARPGLGKTSLALNIADNQSRSGIPGAIFSLEMAKEQLVMRSLSSEARVKSTLFRNGHFSKEDWQKIIGAADKMSTWDNVVIDDTPAINHRQIRQRARMYQHKYGIKYVIVDYLQLVTCGDKKERRDLEISTITAALKAMAKELGIPVLLLSQINRAFAARTDKRPRMSDLRESGAIEQDADVVIFIYRDEVYNKDSEFKGVAEAIIRKQRHGPIGTVLLQWAGEFTKFENLARGAAEYWNEEQ